MPAPIVDVFACSPAEAACAALLTRLDAYLIALYPPEDNHLLSVQELLAPEVSFVAARSDGRVCGCGAIVRRGAEYAEVKRMYVEPWARGRRLGARILLHLEALVAVEGFSLSRLEAGDRQPEALRLYGRSGYRPIGPFGGYPRGRTSVFMEKTLPGAA